jgi:hypothetical protein
MGSGGFESEAFALIFLVSYALFAVGRYLALRYR